MKALELATVLESDTADELLCQAYCDHMIEAAAELRRLAAVEAERDALKAELERIKALEPVAWLSTDCIGERYLAFGRPLDNDPVQPLYALGSKTA